MKQQIEKALMQEWLKHTTATTVAQLAGCLHDLVSDGQQRKNLAVEFYWRMRRAKTRNALSKEEMEHNERVVGAIMQEIEKHNGEMLRKLRQQLEGMMCLRVQPFKGERVLRYKKSEDGTRVSQAFLDGINKVRYGKPTPA